MFEEISKFLTNIKSYVWAISLIIVAFVFVYGLYEKISETIPTKVYAMDKDLADMKLRINVLETDKLLILKDLSTVQIELKEIKQQIAENQKETRAALKEINRDVKDILKTI